VRPIGAQLSTRDAATFGVSLVCAEAGKTTSETAAVEIKRTSARGSLFITSAHENQGGSGIQPDQPSEVYQQACPVCRLFRRNSALITKFARRFVMHGGVLFISTDPYLP
jgi:hypothetical protein